jgi:AmmeMemoRadiSam system protein B
MLRKPVAAGKFYSDNADELNKSIEKLAGKPVAKTIARGIILPHAGYLYSGKVAVTTLNKISAKKNIILLGNNHTGLGQTFSLYPNGTWATPLGNIDTNEDINEKMLSIPGPVVSDETAHRFEHSIEVELPLLQKLWGSFKFNPIACMPASLLEYEKAAAQICEAIKSYIPEIVIIASTDFTHYESDTRARKKDSLAIEQIIKLDPAALVKVVEKENITMCGLAPVCVFINCMKILNARKAQVVLYQTSGDATKDYDSVVGYAGIIVQ